LQECKQCLVLRIHYISLIVFRYAGYANSVIGSIVANRGFIAQYGTVKDPKTGKLALNATHIALWGALYFVTAVLIQTVGPYCADRFGRKFNMWAITFFITLVSSSP
jgi:MFS family permease